MNYGPVYEKFEEDIKNYYKEIIEKYNLKMLVKSIGQIYVESPKCVIVIQVSDYWQPDTYIYDPNSLIMKWYSVSDITKIKNLKLPPLTEEEKKIFDNERNYREYMGIRYRRDALRISLFLDDVLKGDFSFAKDNKSII